MLPELWSELAVCVYNKVREGAYGVLVTHGTDTLGYSAAALSFMLQVPVLLCLSARRDQLIAPAVITFVNATLLL